jgi:hypothetical protein
LGGHGRALLHAPPAFAREGESGVGGTGGPCSPAFAYEGESGVGPRALLCAPPAFTHEEEPGLGRALLHAPPAFANEGASGLPCLCVRGVGAGRATGGPCCTHPPHLHTRGSRGWGHGRALLHAPPAFGREGASGLPRLCVRGVGAGGPWAGLVVRARNEGGENAGGKRPLSSAR